MAKIFIFVSLLVVICIASIAECNDEGNESGPRCTGEVLGKNTLLGVCYKNLKGSCCAANSDGTDIVMIEDDVTAKMLHDVDCLYCYPGYTAVPV